MSPPGPVPMGARPAELAARLAQAVRDVGVLLREWRADSAAVAGAWEGSQFKAHADTMAHEALSARLRAVDPGIPVISEEDPASLASPERDRPARYWLIDPIDGTASYAHGFPGYVTQAALVIEGRPELAAVYAPEPDVGYTAVRGLGATANGRAMPRRPPAPPGEGVLIDNTPAPGGIALAARDHFGYTRYAECGSIALKLCRVAEGSAHLFVKDVPVRDWDVAAPQVIMEETGCALTRLDGSAFDYQGDFAHVGLIGAADPATAAAVARWHRTRDRPHGLRDAP